MSVMMPMTVVMAVAVKMIMLMMTFPEFSFA